jgi:hypothetical protein
MVALVLALLPAFATLTGTVIHGQIPAIRNLAEILPPGRVPLPKIFVVAGLTPTSTSKPSRITPLANEADGGTPPAPAD